MLTSQIVTWLLPPMAPVLVVLAGLLRLKLKPRSGRTLIALGIGTLAILSTALVGSALLSMLEPPFEDPLRYPADAIVVLGGGTYPDPPEYGGDTVSSGSLERLRYAALLYQRSGKPILVPGGNPLGHATAEATQMRTLLQDEWHIPVAWSESASANTHENARNSHAILNATGIRRIYLVTHAWHMQRALYVRTSRLHRDSVANPFCDAARIGFYRVFAGQRRVAP